MAAKFSIAVDAIFKNQNATIPEWFTPTDLNVYVGEITEDGKNAKVDFELFDKTAFNDIFMTLERKMVGCLKISLTDLANLFDADGNYVIPVVNAILQPLNLQYKAS